MKIGLLECDHVPAKFRHIGGDYRQMFEALFPRDTITGFDVCNGRFPDSIQACDAFITTGSKQSVYDDLPWIHELKKFVRELYAREKVFIGVCFGHQMLGEALGGKVGKAAAGWCVGVHTFQILHQESWMNPFQKEYDLMMMCQDQVLELPPDSRVLASTAGCPVGMLRAGPRMLGLQAHPEFPAEYEKALLQDRIGRIGETKVKAALDSLAMQPDGSVISEWIRNFSDQTSIRP